MSDNEKWKKHTKDKNTQEIKENFCGACVAVPLAFMGVGASAYGGSNSSRKEHKKRKKIILWTGVVSVILSIIVAVYFLYIKKCTDCLYTGD